MSMQGVRKGVGGGGGGGQGVPSFFMVLSEY